MGKEPSVDQLVLAGDEGHVSPIDVPRWRLAAAFNAEQVRRACLWGLCVGVGEGVLGGRAAM